MRLCLSKSNDGAYSNIWLSVTFKNDPGILTRAVELHEICVKKMRSELGDDNFRTICFAQALPTLLARRSQARGGNVLGVENLGENCITLLTAAHIKNKEHVELGFGIAREWHDGVVEYAKSVGGWKDWVYLNYADKSQNALSTVGDENMRKIRDAALKYDQDGVFQTKCPGGFKITKV